MKSLNKYDKLMMGFLLIFALCLLFCQSVFGFWGAALLSGGFTFGLFSGAMIPLARRADEKAASAAFSPQLSDHDQFMEIWDEELRKSRHVNESDIYAIRKEDGARLTGRDTGVRIDDGARYWRSKGDAGIFRAPSPFAPNERDQN